MPFNGSGVFTRLRNWVSDANANIKIEPDLHDSEDDGFASGLSNCITKDGQTTITQDIPFNNKKITGLGTATAGSHALSQDAGDARYAVVASPFGTDNRLLRSDGTGRGAQGSAVTVDDSGSMTGVVSLTTTGPVKVSNAAPEFIWQETDAAADQGIWKVGAFASKLTFFATNDADTQADEWLTVQRSGHSVTSISFLAPLTFDVPLPLGSGGTGANLTDPNADRILFWDDSLGAMTWLSLGVGLSITGTTLDATSGTAATQSDQETATSTTAFVSPGRQQYHPSAAKAWVLFNMAGTVSASYNVTSVTDNGAGSWTVTIANDFASANYCAVVGGVTGAGGTGATGDIWVFSALSLAAGTCQINCEKLSFDNTGGSISEAPSDPPSGVVHAVFFGDQP